MHDHTLYCTLPICQRTPVRQFVGLLSEHCHPFPGSSAIRGPVPFTLGFNLRGREGFSPPKAMHFLRFCEKWPAMMMQIEAGLRTGW
jgi:hypothetical protein